METEVVSLTPRLAAEYLSKNKRNRPLSSIIVRKYARVIQRGEWVLNGEPIIFGTDGSLLNGQHRCSAVIEADTPIPALVVRGVAPEHFVTLDIGKIRTTADVFALEGFGNAKLLAAASRYLFRYEQGLLHTTMNSDFTPSAAQLREVVDRHPELGDYVARTASFKSRLGYPSATLLAVFWYLFAQQNVELADWFVNRLVDGDGISSQDAVYRLRESLRLARAGQYTASRFNVLAAITIKAWNATVQNRPIQLLAWRSAQEPFPVIAGCPIQPKAAA